MIPNIKIKQCIEETSFPSEYAEGRAGPSFAPEGEGWSGHGLQEGEVRGEVGGELGPGPVAGGEQQQPRARHQPRRALHVARLVPRSCLAQADRVKGALVNKYLELARKLLFHFLLIQ